MQSMIIYFQPIIQDRQQESRASEYPTIVVREVSEVTHDTPDDAEKPHSIASRGMYTSQIIVIL